MIANTNDESNFTLTQFQADDWCKEHSASLVIITSETVQSAIAVFINDSTARLNSDIITDGYRYKVDPWMWTDGRQSGGLFNSYM